MIINLSVTSKQIVEKFGWFVEVSQWNYAKINTRTNLSIYLQFVGRDISIVGGIQTESCLSKFELKVSKETNADHIANQLASQPLVQEIGAIPEMPEYSSLHHHHCYALSGTWKAGN